MEAGLTAIALAVSEANKYAAGAWQSKRVPKGLLNLVERYHSWRRGDGFRIKNNRKKKMPALDHVSGENAEVA